MQKNCKKSCCEESQVIQLVSEASGAKRGVLCDPDNLFNDESTPPPRGYFQELMLDEVNCDNWQSVKQTWINEKPMSRSQIMAGVADEDENATQKNTQNLQPLWRILTDEDDLIESELRGN